MSVSFPKPLTDKEEKYYISLWENGDENAKNILIERNLRLVAHIAKKYTSNNHTMDDFISIGTIGLIKAVSTYSSGKSTRLATYAAKCIENEILMSMRSSKKTSSEVSINLPIGTDTVSYTHLRRFRKWMCLLCHMDIHGFLFRT